MKRLLVMLMVAGGVIALLRLVPEEQRKALTSKPGDMMGHLAEGRPFAGMATDVQQIRAQNEQILALLRQRPPRDAASERESLGPAAEGR